LQVNPCGNRSYVTPLTRGRGFLSWIDFAFVKCTYRTYTSSTGLNGCGECIMFLENSLSFTEVIAIIYPASIKIITAIFKKMPNVLCGAF
jgi:hypothetical protein